MSGARAGGGLEAAERTMAETFAGAAGDSGIRRIA